MEVDNNDMRTICTFLEQLRYAYQSTFDIIPDGPSFEGAILKFSIDKLDSLIKKLENDLN